MRIISGRFKGAKLASPEGDTTRPTSDRTRESLFNLLSHGRYSRLLKGAHIADICAGTGSVGLEALSRGAAHASFFELDRKALTALRENIKKCRVEGETTILSQDARKAPAPKQPCQMLFLDPPYHRELADQCLTSVLEKGWLAPGGLIVVQVHPKEGISIPDGFDVVDERKYGAARLYFLEESGDKEA